MNDLLKATLLIAVIGFICGIILTLASKFLKVHEDEKSKRIRDCLPGINCGACGFAGCDGYADALIKNDATKTNLCIPGAVSVTKNISEILGVEPEDIGEQIAFIQCGGNEKATEKRFNYVGISTCSAASLYYGGDGKCTYGCIGFGDCSAVCPTGSIYLQEGIAHVDINTCIGCKLCVKTCPKNIIGIRPKNKNIFVACSNKDIGKIAKGKCKNACIACGKCSRSCPTEAITVNDNLATIDYGKCIECGNCAEVCPTGCIIHFKK